VIAGLAESHKSWLRIGALATGLLLLVAAIAFAILLSMRDLEAMARQAMAGLEAETGGRVSASGVRSSLWPHPRVIIDDLQFRSTATGVTATAQRATLSINPVDLIDGKLDSPNLTLEGAVLRLPTVPLERYYNSPRAIAGVADQLSGLFDQQKRHNNLRIVLSRARIVLGAESENSDFVLDPMDIRVKYNGNAGRIDLFARRVSEVRPLEMTLVLPTRAALSTRDKAPAELHLSGFGSRLKFSGTVTRAPDLALSGQIEATIQDALHRALGLPGADRRGRDDDVTSVNATLTLDPRGGGLDGLVIRRGDGRLSGIASLRENNGRWSVSSTLAGDLVDGTAAHHALNRLKTPEGMWSPRELDVNPAPAIDLDVRLSTRNFRLGPLNLENAALSIVTRAGRAEYAVADSQLGAGSLKARLAIVDRDKSQDIRLTMSGEKLDSEVVLDRALGFGRIRGPFGFALQLESRGNSVESLIAGLVGSGSVDIRGGEILGIDLTRLMTRSAETRSEAALIASLGGRSPFEQLSINLAFRNGRMEPVGSVFSMARVDGVIEGHVDLATQQNALSGVLRRRQPVSGQPNEFFAFRIEGPLFHPVVKPDPSLLLRRSGAPIPLRALPG
jgi:AsmA protein